MWLRKAAETDTSAEAVEAKLELGERLVKGDGVPADPEEGRMWLEKAKSHQD